MPVMKNMYGKVCIEGWLTSNEGDWLMKQARECKGAVLEVGSCKGLSSAHIATGIRDGFPDSAHLYCVDHFKHVGTDTYGSFVHNMNELNFMRYITPMRMFSDLARKEWDEDIELEMLFIDGDHSYDGCKADWDAWVPLVKEGGLVILHDAQGGVSKKEIMISYDSKPFPGVARVADEFIKYKVSEWGVVDRICWMVK